MESSNIIMTYSFTNLLLVICECLDVFVLGRYTCETNNIQSVKLFKKSSTNKKKLNKYWNLINFSWLEMKRKTRG